MPHPYDEDLFEHTKMTFGEHLEELRRALLWALVALVVGFIVALLPPVAGNVVEYIQTPLRQALIDFYSQQEIDQLAQRMASEEGRLQPSSANLEQAEALVESNELLSEQVLIAPREVLWAARDHLSKRFPIGEEAWEDLRPTADSLYDLDELVTIHIFRPTQKSFRVRIIGLSAQEPFFVYVKVALVVAIVLASPLVFWSLWDFVAAGLYPHEKQFVYTFLPFSIVLFLAGVALAFFAVMYYVLEWLFWFNSITGVDPAPRMNEWLGFVLILPLGFGVSFQLPLVMLFLERIGVMTVASYLSHWRISVLVIFVLSMLLTPADPTSMILMALPLTALYFGGILLCRFMPRQRTPFGEEVQTPDRRP